MVKPLNSSDPEGAESRREQRNAAIRTKGDVTMKANDMKQVIDHYRDALHQNGLLFDKNGNLFATVSHEVENYPGHVRKAAFTFNEVLIHATNEAKVGMNMANAARRADQVQELAIILRENVNVMMADSNIAETVRQAGIKAAKLFRQMVKEEVCLGRDEVRQAMDCALGVPSGEPGTGRYQQATFRAVQYARYNQPEMARIWGSRDRNIFKDPSGRNIEKAANAVCTCAMLLALGRLTERWVATFR